MSRLHVDMYQVLVVAGSMARFHTFDEISLPNTLYVLGTGCSWQHVASYVRTIQLIS